MIKNLSWDVIERPLYSNYQPVAGYKALFRSEPETISSRKNNIITDIHKSIEIETNALGNNLFGLFNGITHYTTHTRKQKEQVFCNAFGTSADMNNKALNFCENLININ